MGDEDADDGKRTCEEFNSFNFCIELIDNSCKYDFGLAIVKGKYIGISRCKKCSFVIPSAPFVNV